MIKFKEITKIYKSKKGQFIKAIDNVSFVVNSGEFISIVGKSGAGKTTLLKLIFAEEMPTKGSIFFEDIEINKLKTENLFKLRRRIGVVFQDYKLIPSKTVGENLDYIMQIVDCTDQEIKNDIPEVLDIVGLKDKIDHFPTELSGGEQQRLTVARAMIHRPDLILADEPTGNLDPYNSLEIIRLLLKIQEMGTTVVLATHNKEIINRLGKRVITLKEGKIISDQERGSFIL